MVGIRKILVITGDPEQPDATKDGGAYNDEDRHNIEIMRVAFESIDGLEAEIACRHEGLLARLRDDPPDLVVNFCDTGYRNVPTKELHLPAYLELYDIPYTGAPPAALAMVYDKQVVRLVAEAAGIPVPGEFFLEADRPASAVPDMFPALIKPNTADGSVGITKDAVVSTRDEADAYLAWFRETLPGRDALIQEYLPGPEYGIGMIGNPDDGLEALPPLEVDFSHLPDGLPPILSFESKAVPDSPYWTDIGFKHAALDPPDLERMLAACRFLYRRFQIRDWGRFDFRMGGDGVIKLMEVNSNPAWAHDGKLAIMTGFAGLEYRDLLEKMLRAAIRRIEG